MKYIILLIICLIIFYNRCNKIENYIDIKNNTQYMDYSKTNFFDKMQVHFYNFDNIITSKSLYNILNNKNSNKDKCVYSLYQCGRLYDLFGGEYRILQLKQYLSSLKHAGIKLFIIGKPLEDEMQSDNYRNVIIQALKYTELLEYFDGVYTSENKHIIIKNILQQLNIPLSHSLYIDNNNIPQLKEQIHTYQVVDKTHGMNIRDMQYIFNISI